MLQNKLFFITVIITLQVDTHWQNSLITSASNDDSTAPNLIGLLSFSVLPQLAVGRGSGLWHDRDAGKAGPLLCPPQQGAGQGGPPGLGRQHYRCVLLIHQFSPFTIHGWYFSCVVSSERVIPTRTFCHRTFCR